MSSEERRCVVCGRPIEGEALRCSVCGALMHPGCVDEEVLRDAYGDPLCPYDAALAALDWLDEVLTTYGSSLSEDQRREICERMRNLLNLLEGGEGEKKE